MKYLMFAALSMASLYASANDVSDAAVQAQTSARTQQYNQHKGLDVARVISIKNAQDPEKVDGPVNSKMVYVDGSGVTHSLDYTIMGYGRQNG